MIVLGKLKRYSVNDLKAAVLSLDQSILTEALVTQFIGLAPKDQDLRVLSDYEGDPLKLRRAEHFLLEMSRIAGYENRLKCLAFKTAFAERIVYLSKSITTVVKAFQSLRDSELFPKLLELILVVGNFLNSGSFAGNFYGFRITSLNKLADTKGTAGKTTLLEYIAGSVEEKFPEILGFTVELSPVTEGAKVCAQAVREEFLELKSKFGILEIEIDRVRSTGIADHTDTFLTVMEPFYEKAQADISGIESLYQEMEDLVIHVAELYAEDPQKVNPEDFLNVFSTFLNSFNVLTF